MSSLTKKMKENHGDIAALTLRFALAATFLSAVASRLSLWGPQSAGWESFLVYAAKVNSYAPADIIPFLATTATILEITLSLLLLIGYKTRLAAYGAAILTLIFVLSMVVLLWRKVAIRLQCIR